MLFYSRIKDFLGHYLPSRHGTAQPSIKVGLNDSGRIANNPTLAHKLRKLFQLRLNGNLEMVVLGNDKYCLNLSRVKVLYPQPASRGELKEIKEGEYEWAIAIGERSQKKLIGGLLVKENCIQYQGLRNFMNYSHDTHFSDSDLISFVKDITDKWQVLDINENISGFRDNSKKNKNVVKYSAAERVEIILAACRGEPIRQLLMDVSPKDRGISWDTIIVKNNEKSITIVSSSLSGSLETCSCINLLPNGEVVDAHFSFSDSIGGGDDWVMDERAIVMADSSLFRLALFTGRRA